VKELVDRGVKDDKATNAETILASWQEARRGVVTPSAELPPQCVLESSEGLDGLGELLQHQPQLSNRPQDSYASARDDDWMTKGFC
jgi:hypothetical protein